jgi:hypothetical protein
VGHRGLAYRLLSGLMTVDGAMIALIDISSLLSEAANVSDEKCATH